MRIINSSQVDSIKVIGKKQKHACGNNLYLMVSAKGKKSWTVRWTETNAAGATRDHSRTIGVYRRGDANHMTLAQAKVAGIAAKENALAGLDVKTGSVQSEYTLQDVADSYFESAKFTRTSEGNQNNIRRIIANEIPARHLNLDVAKITKVHIDEMCAEAFKAANSGHKACSVWDAMSVVMTHAHTKLLTGLAHPQKGFSCEYMDHKKDTHAENAQNDPLSIEEVQVFLRKFLYQKRAANLAVRYALKFTLMTGLRNTETCNMKWSDINQTLRQFTIGGARQKLTKNREALTLPITAPLQKLLDEVKLVTEESVWIFPSPEDASKPMPTQRLRKCLLGNQDILMLDRKWTVHGLRTTLVTFMTEYCDAPEAIAHAVTNHKKEGMNATYNKATYTRQSRKFLTRYHELLEWIEEGTQQALLDEWLSPEYDANMEAAAALQARLRKLQKSSSNVINFKN